MVEFRLQTLLVRNKNSLSTFVSPFPFHLNDIVLISEASVYGTSDPPSGCFALTNIIWDMPLATCSLLPSLSQSDLCSAPLSTSLFFCLPRC
jgi:hypothetical protein